MARIPDALRQLAESQLGLVTRAQALQFVTEAVLRRLVGPDGRWQIPVRGVYATFTGELTPDQRRMCALLYAAAADPEPDEIPTAMITGLEGLRLLSVLDVPRSSDIDVLIRHARRRQSRSFVRIERTRFYPIRSRVVRRFPVAPLPRCLMDAARHSQDLALVQGLLIANVQNGRVSVGALEQELARGTIAGTARPRRVIAQIHAGAASVAEVPYIDLWASSDVLPPAHHNCTLLTPSRRFLMKPDGYVAEVGLAGQLQSLRYHQAVDAQARDMVQRENAGRYGVQVMEISPNEVAARGREHLAALEEAYVLRKAQGIRPSVILVCRPDCLLRTEASAASGYRY